jgi:nicotinamidase-related amidase
MIALPHQVLVLGYKTYVVLDATRGVADSSVQEAVSDMKQSGARRVILYEIHLEKAASSLIVCFGA